MSGLILPSAAQLSARDLKTIAELKLEMAVGSAAAAVGGRGGRAVDKARNAIASEFPGQLPAGEAIGMFVTVVANAMVGVVKQIEPAHPLADPDRDPRAIAVREFFCELFNKTIVHHYQSGLIEEQQARAALGRLPS